MVDIVIVSDPLCSWCWGMSAAIDAARRVLEPRVRFDLLLGGINIAASAPLGDAARARLARLWREVEVVTGQPFAAAPSAAPFVYNSTSLCATLEAARGIDGAPPFALLARLQRAFFAAGEDVTSDAVLSRVLTELGHEPNEIARRAASSEIRERTAAQFIAAHSYGTNAMPSVLVDDGKRRLLAGGYLDAPTLIATVEAALRARA